MFWDGVFRGGMVVLLLAINFRRDWQCSLTARLGLLLTLSGMGYLFLPALPSETGEAWWYHPLHLAGMAAPGLFWLFASRWFDDDFEVERWHWLVVAALVVTGSVSSYWGFSGNWPGPVMAVCWPVPSLVLIGLGLRAAFRGRDNDLVEGRRRVRLALGLTIGAMLAVIVAGELIVDSWPPPPGMGLINSIPLLVMTLAVALAVFGWRDAALLESPPQPVAAVPTTDAMIRPCWRDCRRK